MPTDTHPKMANVNMSDDPRKEYELNAITANDEYEDATGSGVENVLGSVHISKPSIKHVFFLLRPILKPILEQFNKQEHELHELVNMMKLERTAIDTQALISQNISYEVDYKSRQFLYVFTPQTVTLNLSSGGTIVATTNNWTPLALPRGTKITAGAIPDTQPIQITIRASDRAMAIWAELVNGVSSIGSVNITTNGTVVSSSNPLSTDSMIQELIRAGQGFRVSTGLLSASTVGNYVGVQATVPNNVAKTFLIYRIALTSSVNMPDGRMYTAATNTADAGLTANILGNIANQIAGGGVASQLAVLNTSPAAGVAAPGAPGTFDSAAGVGVQPITELLQGGSMVIFKPNTAQSLALYLKTIAAANTAAFTMEWVEL